jgi:dipeptidyl aminopeptidase/acylaminoacyl peptidase
MTTRGTAGAIERAAEVLASTGLALLGLAWLAPPPAHAAFPGHNGQIAFQSDRDGRHPEIYTMNPDGGCVTRLTRNPSLDGFPTWSPDGRRIAFVSTRDGATDIYVMNANGSDQQRLTDSPAFDGGPAWSPDGQRIAFRSDRSGHPEIYVMDADGSNPTRLTDNPGWDGSPTWSPDGRRIAFASIPEPTLIPGTGHRTSQVYAMDPDGSNQARVTRTSAADGAPDWSPDGRRIAFDSDLEGSFQIHAINPSGTNLMRLTDSPAVDGGPAWSPDGGQVAFRSNRDGVNQIYVMEVDGSRPTRLTNTSSSDRRASWQPLPRPSSNFCLGRVRHNTKRGFARQRIRVPGPGTVMVRRSQRVRRFARQASGAGWVGVLIRPRAKASRRLARAGSVRRRVRVKIRAEVGFRPRDGRRRTEEVPVRLVRVARR